MERVMMIPMTVSIAPSIDFTIGTGTIVNGNNIEYGLTDGTLPMVGVAQVGYAEVE